MKYIILLLMLSTTYQISCQTLNIPLVEVQGNALVYVNPDEVHFDISIDQIGVTISEARTKNEAIVKQVFRFLKSKNIEEKYIQTQHLSVNRKFKRNTDIIDGYIARQSIYICLLDISKFDDIADGLLMMDVARLNGPRFKSSQSNEAKDEARKKAIQDARRKAILFANEVGQKIGPAKLMSETQYQSSNNNSYSTGSSFNAQNSPLDQSFAPGQIKVSAIINISFELLE